MKKQKLLIESVRYITGLQPSVKLKGNTKELRAFQQLVPVDPR